MSSNPIPAAAPYIGDEERAAVDRVLASGMIAQGPEVAAFETEFSPVAGGVECVALNSGTSALHMGLLAAGVKAGDEVIVPSFTFAATGNSVALAGATPVFVDISADSFCLDPKAVEAAITDRTVGIMPVHLYGHPAAMDDFTEIAERNSLAIYEDAAQAHAASLHGKPVGSFGTFGAFSFYPTKNMTSGEGGMVSTGDPELARTVRLLRNQGMERRYENELVGFNTRMTDIHAAIGRVQLTKLAGWTAQRQANAAFLDANLRNVLVPPVAEGAVHVYHQYTIRVPAAERDRIVSELAERGIGSGVYYPIPTHRLPSFGHTFDLPETTRAAGEVISLPVHPKLGPDELARIVEAVNAVAGAGA
ncbi:MAG: DegT/DnrJ/EryC1/StrS family aminotransferase [Actinomycetota bacterium]|nr:DegT/DnrJ/EryC1/StrS family aminotransferase [Actinomycetota bacterium]MDQ2955598.1 DegT/DnrJ/EryC1/StrS family aminotransferase [Actinomycetota bacterium]